MTPAERYRQNAAEYVTELRWCWFAARYLVQLPLQDLLDVAEKAAAAGPFIDPTLYRENGPKLAEDIAMLRALLDARARLLERLPELRAGSEPV